MRWQWCHQCSMQFDLRCQFHVLLYLRWLCTVNLHFALWKRCFQPRKQLLPFPKSQIYLYWRVWRCQCRKWRWVLEFLWSGAWLVMQWRVSINLQFNLQQRQTRPWGILWRWECGEWRWMQFGLRDWVASVGVSWRLPTFYLQSDLWKLYLQSSHRGVWWWKLNQRRRLQFNVLNWGWVDMQSSHKLLP